MGTWRAGSRLNRSSFFPLPLYADEIRPKITEELKTKLDLNILANFLSVVGYNIIILRHESTRTAVDWAVGDPQCFRHSPTVSPTAQLSSNFHYMKGQD